MTSFTLLFSFSILLLLKMDFIIAGWLITLRFAQEGGASDILRLLPSFAPFSASNADAPVHYTPLLTMTVDCTLCPHSPAATQHIRVFDTGNAHIAVDKLPDGGYQFVINNLQNEKCALLVTNADFTQSRCNIRGTVSMQRFGLNNAVMLAYAFASAPHQTLLVHASLVRASGTAYAFIARSGTGKSTQTANWLKTIPETDLMNDDNPIVRIVDGNAIAYGSPWSGKTPCYRQTSAPLGAITQISRAAENSVERLTPVQAFAYILPACSTMKWDARVHRCVCDTVAMMIASVPAYVLHCTKHPQSAVVCHEAIGRKG